MTLTSRTTTWCYRTYLALLALISSVAGAWTTLYFHSFLDSPAGYRAAAIFGTASYWEMITSALSAPGVKAKLYLTLFAASPILCFACAIFCVSALGLFRNKTSKLAVTCCVLATITLLMTWAGFTPIHDLEYKGYWEKSHYVSTYKMLVWPAIIASVAVLTLALSTSWAFRRSATTSAT